MGRGLRGIFKDFYENSGRHFQIKCFEWLNFLIPNLRDSVDLGEVDREGVDLYSLNPDNSYNIVFQCKGFEKTFSESQIKQCKKSIASFIKAQSPTNEFYFILNHEVNSDYNITLTTELNKIIKAKLAKKVGYLTPQTFATYYDSLFQDYILKEISGSNDRFFDSYVKLMEQSFYIEDIPFSHGNAQLKNPINFIWSICQIDNFEKTISSKIKPKFLFLVSEFGFGKTSLLLQFYHFLINKNYTPVFLPVLSFRSGTFSNTSNLLKEIFRVVTQTELEETDKFLKFSSESMKAILMNNPKIVLMFDGLDEHVNLYHKDALKTLFESSIDFVSPTIFSLRTSFWNERKEDFDMAFLNLSKRPHIKKTLHYEFSLNEWDNTTIIKYITSFTEINGDYLTPENNKNLDQFKSLIEDDKYHRYYGDIPKRPLFLEMIILDILSGEIQTRNINELYLKYFSQKFNRDLTGQLEGFIPQRKLPDASIGAIHIELLRIHENLARRCVRIENSELIIENIILENYIQEEFLKGNMFTDIGRFLALSVLVPISKRNNQYLKTKFVHNSFMEYFIAKSIYSDISDADQALDKYLQFEFPESVTSFLSAMIETSAKNGTKELKTIATKLEIDGIRNSLLSFLKEIIKKVT